MKGCRSYLFVAAALLLTACGYDRFGDMGRDDIPKVETLPNADLALLYDNWYGEPFTVHDGLMFEGYVTSDDSDGNFFTTFIIDDGTAAVEVRAGFYDLHAYCQRGRRVVLHAEGLAVGMYNGIIQIGAAVNDYSAYRVEEFGSHILLDRVLERDARFAETLPLEVYIKALDASLCGRLVRISGLVHMPQDGLVTWAQPADGDMQPETGTAMFRDIDGGRIAVVTSGYAAFAGERIPTGKVTLTGILMYGKFDGGSDCFALKFRDLDDVEI